jgi:hypothetical protein
MARPAARGFEIASDRSASTYTAYRPGGRRQDGESRIPGLKKILGIEVPLNISGFGMPEPSGHLISLLQISLSLARLLDRDPYAAMTCWCAKRVLRCIVAQASRASLFANATTTTL